MSSVGRGGLRSGMFADEYKLLGAHSVLGVILSPRGTLRGGEGRKVRLARRELILKHGGEVTVKGACKCLKPPFTRASAESPSICFPSAPSSRRHELGGEAGKRVCVIIKNFRHQYCPVKATIAQRFSPGTILWS